MSRRSASLCTGALAAAAVVLIAAAPAVARHHRPHALGPVEGLLHVGRGEVQSTNWAGYAATGATFTRAQGSWVQPVAHCVLRGRQAALAAFWVGLDGYESNTVEQTGTEADCEGTREVYYAWYELYPERLFLIEEPVKPGDHLHAEVTQTALVLKNETRGWEFEKPYLPGRLEFSSAEWIAEAPFKRFTDFGSVHFTGATASDAGGGRSVEEWEPGLESISLVNHPGPRGSVLAAPEELEGSSFSISQP